MKLFVFTLLIVRTEAMEAAGSPGSIGADVPPVAAHMQPIPDDGLGMTPTAEILTQLVQNSRVTTNAISQLALVQHQRHLALLDRMKECCLKHLKEQ